IHCRMRAVGFMPCASAYAWIRRCVPSGIRSEVVTSIASTDSAVTGWAAVGSWAASSAEATSSPGNWSDRSWVMTHSTERRAAASSRLSGMSSSYVPVTSATVGLPCCEDCRFLLVHVAHAPDDPVEPLLGCGENDDDRSPGAGAAPDGGNEQALRATHC